MTLPVPDIKREAVDLGASSESSTTSTQPLDLDALRTADARDARGRWQPGNRAALRHGLRLKADPPDLATALVAVQAGILADLGGASTATTAEAMTVRELARVSLLVESAGEALIRDGLLTSKGRARSMVAIYQSLLDRQTKLAAMIGLARRSKFSGVAGIVSTVREAGADGQ